MSRAVAIGDKFGRLTVVKETRSDKRRGRFYVCICDCGQETSVYAGHLRNETRVSCGCQMADSKRKHGMSHTPEHRTWTRIKERCFNPHNKRYPHYGARGITICDRWRDSFENFLADMGCRPSPKHSIDRIDNDGNYEPDNCRWATSIEQNNNRSFNRHLVVNRQRVTVAQAAALTGVPHATILGRLDRGLSDEEAIAHG